MNAGKNICATKTAPLDFFRNLFKPPGVSVVFAQVLNNFSWQVPFPRNIVYRRPFGNFAAANHLFRTATEAGFTSLKTTPA